MNKEKIPPIDDNNTVRKSLLPYCRIKRGEIWEDPVGRHKVGCLDAASKKAVRKLMSDEKASLAVQDPPYNVIVGARDSASLGKISLEELKNPAIAVDVLSEHTAILVEMIHQFKSRM